MEHIDEDCDCSSKSSPSRDVSNTRFISAEEVTKVSSRAMKSFTPSTVNPNSSFMQPKIEVNMFPENDLNLGCFQQIETQLLDGMEISEQQPSHSPKIEVFGDDDYMVEPDGNITVPSSGSNISTCLDMPSKRVEGNPVSDVPIVKRSSVAENVPDAPIERPGFHKRYKHADWLGRYLKENGKIPVVFRKKDGRPVGEYASMFMTELGIALKKHAPLQVSGWMMITEEQKRPMFHRLESAFLVDFSLGPNSVKKETDKLMSNRYRDYRQTMHKHYKTLKHLPWEERLKHVPEEYCRSEADWEYLCKMFESETFKKTSLINSGNAVKVKRRPTRIYRGGSKSLSQYKYDADDGSREKDGIAINSDKDCQGESADKANNDEQIGLYDQDYGSKSVDGVNSKRAYDQVPSGYTARHRDDDLQSAMSTSYDVTSLLAANVELRNELHNTKTALQLTEEKVRILEVNQKRLEEKIEANTHIMEANQRMMKQVFEKLASDIAQSLRSSAPTPPLP